MSASEYRPRPEIKAAIESAKMTIGEFARRIDYKPPTLSAKLNGTAPMDSAEEKKILSDIEALKEGVES